MPGGRGAAASFGDTGFFKLLFQHFAADQGAECGGQIDFLPAF